MAKSSIHIETGNAGYLAHNDRSRPTANSIFSDEKNEVWNSKEEAFALYRSELASRSAAYSDRTGQRLQKKTLTHLSAIVNLNQHHTMSDLRKLSNYIEEEFDTKIFQIAIHRDEGHVKDGEPVKNYHAHIEFMGLDSEGASVRKKLTRKALGDLQTKVAKALDMERGTNYAKERKPRPKRLGTYEYKAHKQAEEKAVMATMKDLQAENKQLRAELKEMGATRADYAELEEFVEDLKKEVRKRGLTVADLREQVADRKSQLNELKIDNKALKEQNSTLDHALDQKDAQIGFYEQEIEDRNEKIMELQGMAYDYTDLYMIGDDVFPRSYIEIVEELREQIKNLKELLGEREVLLSQNWDNNPSISP